VLNEHNTVFARSGPLYVIGVSLAHPSPQRKRYRDRLKNFCQQTTDQQTDDVSQSFAKGGIYPSSTAM